MYRKNCGNWVHVAPPSPSHNADPNPPTPIDVPEYYVQLCGLQLQVK